MADLASPDGAPARELDPQERIDWLRLCRTETIGPVTFQALLRRFGSARAALAALPRLARKGERGSAIVAPSGKAAEAELAMLARLGASLVCWGEPAYPRALAAIDGAPPALSVRGHVDLLNRPIVAIVGARNASANGRRLARDLAQGLGQAGIVVVSGLARGIDAAAHAGSLESGSIGIVAGGVDIVYPEENRALHEALAAEGAIAAELAPGTVPQARHFPRRNRIISGMAQGVVVVEAAARSGSLITARLALEQGREVFAVPGSPLDPRAQGTNDLIRHGATLTETADDIIGQLAPLAAPRSPRTPAAARASATTTLPQGAGSDPIDDDAALALVLESLGASPVAVDELVRQCHLSAAAVATLLLELELAGRVERHPGNFVSLR